MRTSKLNIGGNTYLLCMSNRVLQEIESMGQSLESFLSDTNKTVTNTCWLVRKMSAAGSVYAKKFHLGDYQTISEEDIMDASGSDDYAAYMDAILEAASGERHVDAEPPKNAEAAHAEALNG